jgi:hypothetical protein
MLSVASTSRAIFSCAVWWVSVWSVLRWRVKKKAFHGERPLKLSVIFSAVCIGLGFFASVTRKFASAGQSCFDPETGQNPLVGDIPDSNNTD